MADASSQIMVVAWFSGQNHMFYCHYFSQYLASWWFCSQPTSLFNTIPCQLVILSFTNLVISHTHLPYDDFVLNQTRSFSHSLPEADFFFLTNIVISHNPLPVSDFVLNQPLYFTQSLTSWGFFVLNQPRYFSHSLASWWFCS